MRKLSTLLVLLTLVALPLTALAKEGQEVCQGLDSGKIDTSGDPLSVTVVAPEGKLISEFCVKAGSDQSVEDGAVRYFALNPPVKEFTISHPSGKAVSHYSVGYVDEPTTTTTTPEETTTTQPETTTTTPEETTTTVPEETTTTTPVTTTTTPPTELPFTGAGSTALLSGLALALLGSGGYLVRRARNS